MPAMKKEVAMEVQAKTLCLHLKVSDRFTARLLDQNGDVIIDQDDGYVPSFMPGKHYGDYVILDIDIDTGQIKNWKPVTGDALEKWMETRK